MLDRIGGDLQTNNTWRNTIDGAVDYINDNILMAETTVTVHAVDDVRVTGHWTKNYTGSSALQQAIDALPHNQNKHRIYIYFVNGTLESPAEYNFPGQLRIYRFFGGEIYFRGDTSKTTKGIDNKVVVNFTYIPSGADDANAAYYSGLRIYNCHSQVTVQGIKFTTKAKYAPCVFFDNGSPGNVNYCTFSSARTDESGDRIYYYGEGVRCNKSQVGLFENVFDGLRRALYTYNNAFIKTVQNEDVVTLKRKHDHVTAEINDLTSQIDALPDGAERDALIAKRTTKQNELNNYNPSTFASDIARPQYGMTAYEGVFLSLDSMYSGRIVGATSSEVAGSGSLITNAGGNVLETKLATRDYYVNIPYTYTYDDIKRAVDELPKNQNGYNYYIRFGYDIDGEKLTGTHTWDFGGKVLTFKGFTGGKIYVRGDLDSSAPGPDGENSRFTITWEHNDYNGAMVVHDCHSMVEIRDFKFHCINKQVDLSGASVTSEVVTLTLPNGHGFSKTARATISGLVYTGAVNPNVVDVKITRDSSDNNTYTYSLEGATNEVYTAGSSTIEQLNTKGRAVRNVRATNMIVRRCSFNFLNHDKTAINTQYASMGIFCHDGKTQIHDCRFNNVYYAVYNEYNGKMYIEDSTEFYGTPAGGLTHRLPKIGTSCVRGALTEVGGAFVKGSISNYYVSVGGQIGNRSGLIWEEMFGRRGIVHPVYQDSFDERALQAVINDQPKVQNNNNFELRFEAGPSRYISAASLTSNVVTITAPNHGFSTNDEIHIDKHVEGTTSPRGKHTITVTDSNNFTFPLTGGDEVYDVDLSGSSNITAAELASNGTVDITLDAALTRIAYNGDKITVSGLSYTGAVNPNVTDAVVTRLSDTRYRYRATAATSGVTTEVFGVSGATMKAEYARAVKPNYFDFKDYLMQFHGFTGGDITLKSWDYEPDQFGKTREVTEFRTNEDCYRTIITGYKGGWAGMLNIDDSASDFFIKDLHFKIRNDDDDNYVDNQECVLVRNVQNCYFDDCKFTGVGYTASGGNTYDDSVGFRISRSSAYAYGCWFSNLKNSMIADDNSMVVDRSNETFEFPTENWSYPSVGRVAQSGGRIATHGNNMYGTYRDAYVAYGGLIFPNGGVIFGDPTGSSFGTTREDVTGITVMPGRKNVLP